MLPGPRAVGAVPAPAALRRDRRVPRLPRAVRLARRAGAAAAAAGVRALRLDADLRAGVGDGGRPGACRRRGWSGCRSQAVTDDASPRGATHVRAVGAAADRAARRARRAGAPGGRGRGRAAAGRSRRRGRPHAGLRPLAPRGGARPRWAPARHLRRGRGWTRSCRGSPPTAPATCPRSGGRWRRRCPRASCSASRPRTRWSWASTSPGWTRWCWPASRARWPRCGSRPAGPGAPARRRWWCSWPATTRWTPTSCTTRRRCSAGRSRPPSSTRRTRTCWHRSCAARRPSCRCATHELAIFAPIRTATPRAVRDGARRAGRAAACCGGARPAGSGPAATGPTPTSAAPAARRWRWSRRGTGSLVGTVDGGAAHSHGARGRGLPAPGPAYVVDELDLDEARRAGPPGRPAVDDDRPRRHRHRDRRHRAAAAGYGPLERRARHGRRHQPGGRLPAPPARHRRADRRDAARPAARAQLRTDRRLVHAAAGRCSTRPG